MNGVSALIRDSGELPCLLLYTEKMASMRERLFADTD